MDACPRYLCTCVYVIVCMSARKKAPVNLLMCPFELYMFIGVSMQLRSHTVGRLPLKKKNRNEPLTYSHIRGTVIMDWGV